MTRWIAAIAIALSLPVVLAYAQEIGNDASTTPGREVVETNPEVTIIYATSTDPVDAPAGEVMGTSTETQSTSTEPAPEQAPAQNTGGSSDPAAEPALEIRAPQASTTPEAPLVPEAPVDIASTTMPQGLASTTASSTEVIPPPPSPYKDTRTVIIQPSFEMGYKFAPGTVNATVIFANQTCINCKGLSPAARVEVYVTPWYENKVDAVIPPDKIGLQTLTVLPMAGWATSTAQWSGQITTPGKYYLNVSVDPAGEVGARDMIHTEFVVE